MFNRAIRLTFGGALSVALGGVASAAIPNDGAQPSDKPALNRASPMINDPVGPIIIHGQAPGTIIIPKDNAQADLPDATKPPLYRASPMINDPLIGTPIHGTPSAKPSP